MNDDGRLEDLRDLRLLDPAHAPRPDAGRSEGAQSLLGRVLDGSLGTPAHGRDDDRRRDWGRWAVAGAAAAAIAAGAVLLPPWGETDHAFASWTPVPEEVSAAVLDTVAEECTNELAATRLGTEVVIAEERGRVVFGVLSRPGYVSHCLLVDGQAFLSGAGSTVVPGRAATPAPDEVQTVLVAGGGGRGEDYTTITGRVGADVVGVEVHVRGLREEPGVLAGGRLPETITATVENGYYGAWWPGVGAEDIVLTVHLEDGTVLSEVPTFDR
ncbi:MAG TPA: hypothetical protein VKZ83_05310 [Phototrophicaceae bacterium]|nr:hypothetical protein [Phototrophicaceae bacterium]